MARRPPRRRFSATGPESPLDQKSKFRSRGERASIARSALQTNSFQVPPPPRPARDFARPVFDFDFDLDFDLPTERARSSRTGLTNFTGMSAVWPDNKTGKSSGGKSSFVER